MRAVSRATWTSVEPVSPSERPYLPISSCFFSWVRLMRAARIAIAQSRHAEVGTELARRLHVAAHLRDQILHALEALLAAQAADERNPQRVAVEIGVVIDQVGLHEQAAPGLEGGSHPHVHRGGEAIGKGGVDAVPGND